MRALGWIGYALILLFSLFLPLVWGYRGLLGVSSETYAYKWFPSWARWIVESKNVFRR